MATVYSNNFDSDTVGALPANWTNLYGTSWVVGTNTPVSSPNSFRGTTDGHFAAYTGAAGTLANSSIKYQVIKPSTAFNCHGLGLRMNSGYTQGYLALASGSFVNATNVGTVQLYKRVSSSWTAIGSGISFTIAGSPVTGDTINFEFEANGTSLTLYAWKEGTTKPTSGTGYNTWTDSTYSAAGYPGLYNASTSNPAVDNVVIDDLAATTTYGVTGPSGGLTGQASTNFTVSVTGTLAASTVFTPNDSSGGGTFTPTSLTLSGASPSGTFTYTPASAGEKTITVTNDQSLTVPASLTYTATAVATAYTLTGPSGGTVGAASTNFTVAITGTLAVSTVITPSDAGDGGTFTPTSVTLAAGTNVSGTFTYTPASTGAKTISTSDDQGLTDPASLTYTAASGPITVPVDNANLFWAPGAWDTIDVGTYSVATKSKQSANPGAYLKFRVLQATDITLSIDPTIFASATTKPTIVYSINGGAYVTNLMTDSTTTLAILSGASAADINIDIWIMCVEAAGNRWSATAGTSLINGVRLTGVIINSGATMAAYSMLKTKKMLVFGDSITEGVYAGTGWISRTGAITANDPASTFAPVMAEGLEAEFGQIGFGGQGWTINGTGVPAAFPATWNKFSTDRARDITGLDYLAVFHGCNDRAVADATVQAAVYAWLVSARAAVGSSTWIFVIVPAGAYAVTGITSGVAQYAAAYPADLKTVLIDLSDKLWSRWFDGNGTARRYTVDGLHPTVNGHALIAAAMLDEIKTAIGGTVSGGEYSSGFFG